MAQVWLIMKNEPLKKLCFSKLRLVAQWLTKCTRGMKKKELLQGFTEWLTRLNYSIKSVQERSRQLETYLNWKDDNQEKDLEAYNKWLHDKPLKSKTITGYIGALKLCNQYLENHGRQPIMTIKLRIGKDLESSRNILSEEQIKKLYETCNDDLYGKRDRAIIAVFYGCGLRCREGANLEQRDIDFKSGLLHVRKGKGYKERYVPMSPGVMKELKEWLENGQPFLSGSPDRQLANLIIPSRTGKIIGCHGLTRRVKMMCHKSKIKKSVSLHGLRHSIATHLLDSGMGIEKIGQFLGHSSLETTQIYTRVRNGI